MSILKAPGELQEALLYSALGQSRSSLVHFHPLGGAGANSESLPKILAHDTHTGFAISWLYWGCA